MSMMHKVNGEKDQKLVWSHESISYTFDVMSIYT